MKRKFYILIAVAMIAMAAFAQKPARTSESMTSLRHSVSPVSGVIKPEARSKAIRAGVPPMDLGSIIYSRPEGTLRTYNRAGTTFRIYYNQLIRMSQEGLTMEIVTAPDGTTVYLKDIVASIDVGTWVKGTIDGDKIRVPLYQCIEDYQTYGVAIAKSVAVFKDNGDGTSSISYQTDTDATEMTFTISADGKTLSLDGTDELTESGNPTAMLSAIYTDDYSWTGYGDFQTVYTEIEEAVRTMPVEAVTESWSYEYADEAGSHKTVVTVGTAGDRLYVQGLSDSDPESVIEGTIDGDKVTFASDQYLGAASGYMLYFSGATYVAEEVEDPFFGDTYMQYTFTYQPELVMAYDAEGKRLTAADDEAFVVNIGKGSEMIRYWGVGLSPKLEYFDEVAAVPANPDILEVDESMPPYLLRFDIKTEDTEGNFINPSKLSYVLWVKAGDEAEKFVFSTSDYYTFKNLGIEELVEVPYFFESFDMSGYNDISTGGSEVYIYQLNYDDYGVQSVYYGGGDRRESDIVWYRGGIQPSGIGSVSPGATSTEAAAWFSPDGKRLSAPRRGLNIVRMADGSVKKIIF